MSQSRQSKITWNSTCQFTLEKIDRHSAPNQSRYSLGLFTRIDNLTDTVIDTVIDTVTHKRIAVFTCHRLLAAPALLLTRARPA